MRKDGQGNKNGFIIVIVIFDSCAVHLDVIKYFILSN